MILGHLKTSVKIFDSSADTRSSHLRHNSPVSVLKVWPTSEQDPCLPNTIIVLTVVILIRCVLVATGEAELEALIKRGDRVGHAVAARLHNGEFGSPATAKRH